MLRHLEVLDVVGKFDCPDETKVAAIIEEKKLLNVREKNYKNDVVA